MTKVLCVMTKIQCVVNLGFIRMGDLISANDSFSYWDTPFVKVFFFNLLLLFIFLL